MKRYRRPWGSYVWQRLAVGAEWLSLVRCPIPYVLLRERGGDAFKLFAGRPQKVDPTRQYEWATFQLEVGQSFGDVAGASGQVGGETIVGVTKLPGPDGIQNWTELLGGAVPVEQAVIRGSWALTNAQASNEGLFLALACEEADTITVEWLPTAIPTGDTIQVQTKVQSEIGTVGVLTSELADGDEDTTVRHAYTSMGLDGTDIDQPRTARALPAEHLQLLFDYTGSGFSTLSVLVEMRTRGQR